MQLFWSNNCRCKYIWIDQILFPHSSYISFSHSNSYYSSKYFNTTIEAFLQVVRKYSFKRMTCWDRPATVWPRESRKVTFAFGGKSRKVTFAFGGKVEKVTLLYVGANLNILAIISFTSTDSSLVQYQYTQKPRIHTVAIRVYPSTTLECHHIPNTFSRPPAAS